MIEEWWRQAEAHKVLPLDDRFAPRFADNAKRFHGPRNRFVFHAGMGHVPTDVAPDVRNRTYTIEADAHVDGPTTEGVLIAHGDATTGYSLYMKDGRLSYDMNIGGEHHLIVSDRPVPAGNRRLGMRMRRNQGRNIATLLIDGEPAGSFETQNGFVSFISWSGLDIGRDRSSPVSHYEAPFAFTGKLRKVTVLMDDDQALDAEAGGNGGAGARVSNASQPVGHRQRLRLAAGAGVDGFCICTGRRRASICPWSALKEMAADFGDQRAACRRFAYMVGFFGMGVGGVFMGWLADRTSPRVPLLIAGISIAFGGLVASRGGEIALYAGYAMLLGFFGNAGTFTPAMNNVQGWFDKRRNIAVAIISIGPAIAGSVWPQVYRLLLPEIGWRDTLVVYGLSLPAGCCSPGALYVRPAPVVARTTAEAPARG